MDNADIARFLDEIADLLELANGNQFRIRAYRTAARTIQAHGESVAAIAARDAEALAELPGIGKDLAGKIAEIATSGDLALRRELVAKVPESLVEMMRVANVGPKRAKRFYEELGIRTLDELEAAAREGRLRMRGIGETLEREILEGCAAQRIRASRYRLDEADAHVSPVLAWLRGSDAVELAEAAGSLRRRRETIGDLDILVSSRRPDNVAERFLAFPEIRKVLAHGETKCAAVLRSGMQVDVRIVEPPSWGAALHYFTGSKSHNIAVRKLGSKRGLKISEYGVFRGARRVGGRTEEEVFRAVELPWIPPELREDHGEIEAAREGRLPELVRLEDLKGDLHMHTDETDGVNTLREMVEACAGRGYEYLAITDHTKAVRVAGGLDRTGFRRQRRAIDALRQEFPRLTILHGAEVDILPDGTLDLEDDALAELDLVVAAVHSKLAMPEREMTERILRALAHPRVHVLAHPTGRLLGKREPYAVDLPKVVRAAFDHSVLLEINAQPERLDLCDVFARIARDCGAKLVVSTDAHRVAELDFIRYGIDQARRGWCCASDVANTRSFEAFRAILRPRGREADGASRTPAQPPGGHARTRATSVRGASSRASTRAAR